MKEFSADLFKVLTRTIDGLATSIIVALFLAKGVYQIFFLGGGNKYAIEASLFSIIAVLMMVRLRHDTPAEVSVHWGSLASVVGFAACIFILR